MSLIKCGPNLKRFEIFFHDASIRLDQAHKDGKFLVSTDTTAKLCKGIEELVKELQKSFNVP